MTKLSDTNPNNLALIGESANRVPVFYDTQESHAATHFRDDDTLFDLTKAALNQVELVPGIVPVVYDFGRYIGVSNAVVTTDDDTIVYARRPNRENYSRFALDRKPVPTTWITMLVDVEAQGRSAVLGSAWMGPYSPPFPGDPYEQPESAEYWERHALVWGTQTVDDVTITHECPWEASE